MGSRVTGALRVRRPSQPLFCAEPAPPEAVTAVAADGRPDALFEPSPALARGGVAPTADYLAARAALRARPPAGAGSRRSAPGGAVETAPLPHRHRRPPRSRQMGGPTGRRAGRRDARLRSADGHDWTWADTARVGNGPRAYGRVPSPLRIARAIPPGHRRAGQAHRWLARVREAALAEFRLDAAERRIGAHRGSALAWDNNETRGTLGLRALAHPDANRTVWDLLADVDHFQTMKARIGDLAAYTRPQGEARFDVLASDGNPARMAQVDAVEFRRIREVLARFYGVIVIDTGNNVRASNWQAAVDAADALVVVSTYQADTAEGAGWVLDHLHSTAGPECGPAGARPLPPRPPVTGPAGPPGSPLPPATLSTLPR